MVDFSTYTDYDSQGLLGFQWKNGRLACVLSTEVPNKAPETISKCVYPMLKRHDLDLKTDIKWLMLHPGGKAVIDNVQKAVGLSDKAMEPSREALRLYGNCSSTSVGLLSKMMVHNRRNEIQPGDWGLVTTLGSGMNATALLLRWPQA